MFDRKPDGSESRIDFQQMLKDLESENVKPVLKDVRQADIADLFKKTRSPQDSKPQ